MFSNQEISIPYIVELADSFEHWMKKNNQPNCSNKEPFLNWLYADSELAEIKNQHHFYELIQL